MALPGCAIVKTEPGLRGDIARTIEGERDSFTSCYEKNEAAQAGREIHLRVGFRVSREGQVVNARTVERDVLNPALESCVLQVFEKMRFKPADDGGTIDVVYPFRFTTKI